MTDPINGSITFPSSSTSWVTTSITPADSTVAISNNGITLKEGADITVNNVSLTDLLTEITNRLDILIPNPRLEKEYQELKQAREEYQRIENKIKMLEVLKNTPVDTVDR